VDGITNSNDLATKSALGQEGLDRQVRAVVEAAIASHQGVEVDQQQERVKVQTLQDKSKRQRKAAKVA
jgi:hypothetical protein